ncbi:MAG: hypothetical protein PHW04_00430 [Candidatus Wallbacteria bacterium]|nr:hypothetical protein [Candidatus Wallbacteria bacterium]
MKFALLIVMLVLVQLAGAATGAVQRLTDNGMELTSNPDMLSITAIDKPEHPFLVITRMKRIQDPQKLIKLNSDDDQPRATQMRAIDYFFSRKMKQIQDSADAAALLYKLQLDCNLDGIVDLEIAPGCYTVGNSKEVGISFSEITEFGKCGLMPDFGRMEAQLHGAMNNDSYLRQLKFAINRLIVRRNPDGNLLITLRDKFFKTGSDIELVTQFSWEN